MAGTGRKDIGPKASYEAQSAAYSKLYRFSTKYLKFLRQPREYLTRSGIGLSEMHLITRVCDNPGLTVSEMAKLLGCTPGAVSQFAGKGEKRGLLRREKQEGNDKLVHLFLTPAGEVLAREHKAGCSELIGGMEKYLEGCTDEEISGFFKVIDRMNEFLENTL